MSRDDVTVGEFGKAMMMFAEFGDGDGGVGVLCQMWGPRALEPRLPRLAIEVACRPSCQACLHAVVASAPLAPPACRWRGVEVRLELRAEA